MFAPQFLLIAAALTAVSPSEPTGAIRGVVLDGSSHAAVVDAEVILRVKTEGQFIVAAETRTDETGHFDFHPLPLRPDLVFLPGANHGGVHYPGRRIQLTPETPNVDVILTVHDVITAPSPLVAGDHDIVIEPQPGALKVTETIQIENPTTKAYVGQADSKDAEPVTLTLSIPTDFERTTFHKEFFGRRFSLSDTGLVTHIPWEPGTRELKFTYVIPNTKQQHVWRRPLDLPTARVRIRVRCDDPESVACSLPTSGQASTTDVVFESSDTLLPVGHVLTVEMGRLPLAWMVYGRWLALGVLLLGVGIAALILFRRPRDASEQPIHASNQVRGKGQDTKRRGFTLVELLVVIAIIAILIALMDGSTRSVSNSIDQGVWRALGTRNSQEVIGEF